jgi:hypothetical protein
MSTSVSRDEALNRAAVISIVLARLVSGTVIGISVATSLVDAAAHSTRSGLRLLSARESASHYR